MYGLEIKEIKVPSNSLEKSQMWTDCVVNLSERSLTTLDSVCNGPEFEGTKFKSNDTMGFADEE